VAPVLGTVSKIGQNAPMRHLGYLAMLIFTICGSFWLEIVLKVQVLKRIKRVAQSILPVAIVFLLWDAFAISKGHWTFDASQILGIFGPGRIPLEEYLFFLIIPIAAIMTLEAVRKVKSHWIVGDEK
jgi:lycopene cyclase domain-containing protein